MFLSATKLRNSEVKSSRLSASGKVFELSSEISDITNLSEIKTFMNRGTIKLKLSWLSKNMLCAISYQSQELNEITKMRKGREELENSMNKMKIEESRIYGNILQQNAAPAA